MVPVGEFRRLAAPRRRRKHKYFQRTNIFVTILPAALKTHSAERLFNFMNEEIKDAQLDEDHHTKVRYLSWLEKVADKWEPQRAVLRAGETHPVLDKWKSLEEHSRLT